MQLPPSLASPCSQKLAPLLMHHSHQRTTHDARTIIYLLCALQLLCEKDVDTMASKTNVLLVQSLNFVLLNLLLSTSLVVVHCFQPIVPFTAHRHPSKTLLLSSITDTTDEQPSASIISGPPAITARDLTCSFDGGNTYQLQSASYILPRGGRGES